MLNLPKANVLKLTFTILLMICASTAWAEPVEFDGLIEPNEIVDIGAPAEGIVSAVAVDRSSPVERGQLLVSLESSVEQAAMERAKAMAAFSGEINLQQTQLAFAKRAYQRVRKLKAISTHDKDQADTEVGLARHRLAKARQNRDLAKLELQKSKALLDRRKIKSPISGVVMDRYVSPGEYVNNQPLLRIAQIDPLRVEVIVPARIFGKITPGMTATIHPELPEYGEQTASVAIVDKVIDAASSTFGVRLELPNPDLRMPSGLKCVVRFDLDAQAEKAENRIDPVVPNQARN